MGRYVDSPIAYATGDTYETAYTPPYGFIEADGSYQLKSAYPALATAVGDAAFQYDSNGFVTGTLQTPFNTEYTYSNRRLFSLTTDGTKFVTTAGTSIWVSDDGLRWKPVLYITTATLNLGYARTIKYSGGRWFAYTKNTSNTDYLTSTDGETWSKVTLPFAFIDFTFDGTDYVFACNSTVRYGTNPLLTTSASYPSAANLIEKIGSAYISWSPNITGAIYRSTDGGATWTLASALTGVSATYSIANGRLFIASNTTDGTSRPYWTSSADGTSWAVAGTSFNWTSNSNVPSDSCVVWDGTRYSMGVQNNSSNSFLATATSETGAITQYASVNTGEKNSSGMQIAYKSGVYLMTASGYASAIYKFTASPTANWQSIASGDQAAYTVYPSIFATRNGVWAENKRSPIRAYIGAFDSFSGNTPAWKTAVFIEDSSGYWFPYDFGSTLRYTSYGSTGSEPGGLTAALLGDTYICIGYYAPSTMNVSAYTLNNTTKTITISSSTGTSNSNTSALYATSKYVFMITSNASGTHRWSPTDGFVPYTSWGGGVNNFTGGLISTYTYEQDILVLSGVRTTPYGSSYSTDGGANWTSITPSLINSAGTSVTLAAHAMYYYKGVWIIYQGGAYYSTTNLGGAIFTAPAVQTGFIGLPTTVTNFSNYIFNDYEVYSSLSLNTIGFGSKQLNAASGACGTWIYTFSFGSFACGLRTGANPAGLYSAQFAYPLGVSPTTYFKVPNIAPTTFAKTMYINAR